MLIKADIHVHTCLSPCADIRQSPKRVIEKAYEKGLNLIFITDHNSTENSESAMIVSEGYKDMMVYPGMEITSREEVHTLALFENKNDARSLQNHIYQYLPDTDRKMEYENQILANANDEFEGYLKKSLFNAVDLKIERIIELIHQNNGIAIAAHIDRESFSIISQLGFIPDELKFDALEISPNLSIEKAKDKYPEYSGRFKFVKGSDSHFLEQIGSTYTEYEGQDNTFKSLFDYINERPLTAYT